MLFVTTRTAVSQVVQRSSSDEKVGSLIPGLCGLHVKGALSKILNPKSLRMLCHQCLSDSADNLFHHNVKID